ncbi:MAG TPA: hypothetical protein VJ624_10010 [Thermodesulfobacteriota bacterium]|nr:hypothetical protein [Thermodesulfobacteriota bacterium]
MENETIKKLNVLLTHWLDHNREHAAEYDKWALQAKAEGFAEVSNALKEASDVIQKTNEKLLKTWEILKKLTKE